MSPPENSFINFNANCLLLCLFIKLSQQGANSKSRLLYMLQQKGPDEKIQPHSEPTHVYRILLNFACCHTKKIMKQYILLLMIFINITLTGTNSAASAQFFVFVGLCFVSVTIWHNIVEEK